MPTPEERAAAQKSRLRTEALREKRIKAREDRIAKVRSTNIA